MITGRILHLQRLSTEDGPGLRTTVFFKGCPLRCVWCHNPESLISNPQTQWFSMRCLACQTCVETCPNGCLSMVEENLVIDRGCCEACGKCAQACPSGALELLGRTVTVEEVIAELLKDRAYYEKSGGGVTLSGGEPAFQPEFAAALLQALKQHGISTALDTCGLCSVQVLDCLLPHTDLVLFDLKLLDSAVHAEYTGATNARILENLQRVRDYVLSREPAPALWIRTPLIPGATAVEGNLLAIGRHLADHLDGAVSRWELCAFNNLCRDQYTRLDMQWQYSCTPLMTHAELAQCEQAARASGFPAERIFATGAVSES
jgi:pyruvate formate lyase activating enzyme